MNIVKNILANKKKDKDKANPVEGRDRILHVYFIKRVTLSGAKLQGCKPYEKDQELLLLYFSQMCLLHSEDISKLIKIALWIFPNRIS